MTINFDSSISNLLTKLIKETISKHKRTKLSSNILNPEDGF
jgi:hypothetical protein